MSQYLNHRLLLHHLHFTEINELYISLSLQAFSMGLIGIFIPIYIYNLGFSISVVATFFLVTILTQIALFPISSMLVNRFGPKHIMSVSYFLMFFYTILLFILPTHTYLLFPAAVIIGIADDLFWMPRHIDLATIIQNKNIQSRFSTLLIFLCIAKALAPLIGGVVATHYGIGFGLIGTSVGLLIAVYPLLKTPEPIVPRKTNLRLFRTAPPRHMIANFAQNAQGTVTIYLWPLFIFLIVKTYQNVGIVSSASLILIVVLLHFLGHLGKNNKMLKTGSNLRSGVHILRTFAQSFTATLGVNILGDITDALVSVPYATRFYQNARKYDIPAYLTDMEVAGGFGKTLPWIVLLVASMFYDLQTALIITFVMAALLMPLLRLIEPTSSSKNV